MSAAKQTRGESLPTPNVAEGLPLRGDPYGMPLAVPNVRARGGTIRVVPVSLTEETDTGHLWMQALTEGKDVRVRVTASAGKFLSGRQARGVAAGTPCLVSVASFMDPKPGRDGEARVVEYLALAEEVA
jgi:hypothetical protein